MSTKPGVVLVHGAWHSPWHFQNIITELKGKGYLVEAPAMPIVSLKADKDCVAKSIAVVKQAISNVTSSGRNAVVVCHSFGGIMGSEAVAEFEEGMRDESNSQGHGADQSDEPHALELKDGLLHHLEPIERFYNTMEPALAQQCADKLLPLDAASGMTPTKYRGWADYGIPVTYIACEQDMALTIDGAQSKSIKRFQDANVKDFTVERIDCDHTPWLSNGQSEFFRILWNVLDKASPNSASRS